MTHPHRQRGSKDIWLGAAYDLLVSQGIEGVKVAALAKRLNLTRTGFYWFFADLDALHRAMITRWEQQNTGTLEDRCERPAASITEALFNLMDCWLDPLLFDARLDLAIRNWARIDAALAARVQEADARRIKAVSQMFARHGFDAAQAQTRGLTVIYTQIGYISMEVAEDRAERLARVQHYVELFAASAPAPQEVAAFLARHS